MNLHGIVSPGIGAVNPSVPGTVLNSTGYTTAPNGKQTPTYASTAASLQVQKASGETIRHLDGLNIQGVIREVWAFGNIEGLDRITSSGGASLVFGGFIWYVVQVIETWDVSGWCHVAVLRQGVYPPP
jgi:hypothetical protein